MEWYDIEVNGRETVQFADLPYVPLTSPPQSPGSDGSAAEAYFIGQKLGGIIRHGDWAWLACNSVLQIVSVRTGQTIASYEFCEARGYENCCIKCVEQICPDDADCMLLAVSLECFRGPGGGCSYIALYSIELADVLSTIELSLHITCARFMNAVAWRRTLLQSFDGCLAVGSEEGVIVLLDLNVHKILSPRNSSSSIFEPPQANSFVQCHIVDYNLPLIEIHRNFRQCQQDGIAFGLQLEVIASPCSIQCILPIDLILGLGIGLEDGRMALYDLSELQIFYIARPQHDIAMSALVKMDFLEPPDDPRPCVYIWTMHENGENLYAVLHSLMYEKRVIEEDGGDQPVCYFENFLSSAVRLQLPLEASKSVVLACQAISTLSNHGEDDSNCLCAISWYSFYEEKNKLVLFDLNQWYKEEMPFVLEYGKQPNYLAGYILNGQCTGLHCQLNTETIAHFNSMQRYEEHFYPNSLSFDCSLLNTEGCRIYNWDGAQNKVINYLRASNAAIFLEPNFIFNEIMKARLMPQFCDLNPNSTFSRDAQYELMLSCALEHNCFSLLRDCARSWLDGSFMGNFTASTGLSLSTLTDWAWKRATDIKTRCNDMCKGLFEFGGYPLDNREQKELGFITRQLKLLSELLNEILQYSKKQIPERVYSSLENKYNSLLMASSYQDILLWLLNIGLLPEASAHNAKINATYDLIPYPYKELKEMYKKKRSYFAGLADNFVNKKTGSCRLLYIDTFIEHECKGNVLREYWLENAGDGLYPPTSIEAMLRVMLVPELEYDNKCAILLYFFLDLNMAIDEEVYKGVVANFIKFPSVFKLPAPLIKTVQAFWNLDHGHFLPAVDEFISPFNKNQKYPQWLIELLIESLLAQNSSNLALRILESQPSLISPMLKLKCLLANELLSEAFHFVRSKHDEQLLELFFTCCIRTGQFGVIRDLALSEKEGLILQNILKRSNAPGSESLHFVYLLQKSKYIEAVSYMDELSKTKSASGGGGVRGAFGDAGQQMNMETPNLVLSAFNTTMTPVTQGLTDVYFRIKNRLKKKEVDNNSPVPLSCQLIKQNANSLLGGIYHSSALSAHFATYYWGADQLLDQNAKNPAKRLLSSNNAPFLRRPQNSTNYMDLLSNNSVSYPQPYRITEKRTLAESEILENNAEELERQRIAQQLNPKKKRRLAGQEIVDNLTHFMKINRTNLNSGNEFKFDDDVQTNANAEKSEPAALDKTNMLNQTQKAMEFITKPLAQASSSLAVAGRKSFKPMLELQSILKTQTPDRQEEEKNLRFDLPAAESNDSIECVSVVENEQSLAAINKPALAKAEEELNVKRKSISRSISIESNKSSASSSNCSEDNFYSPMSSRNNSKLDSSCLSRASILSGPKPRKALGRLSAERSEEKSVTPEPVSAEKEEIVSENSSVLHKDISKDSSYWAYKTARSSLSQQTLLSRKSLNCLSSVTSKSEYYYTATTTTKLGTTTTEECLSQGSSGFGSISSAQTGTFAGSHINEFIPKISSSKVGHNVSDVGAAGDGEQHKSKTVDFKKPSSPTKLSECSTVLGSLTTFESGSGFSMPNSIAFDKSKAMPKQCQRTDEEKRHMLETTLSMSTYDITNFDTTSLQQTKSMLMQTAQGTPLGQEKQAEELMVTADETALKENAEEEDEKEGAEAMEKEIQQMEVDEEEAAINENKQEETNAEKEESKKKEEMENFCIVLTSSEEEVEEEDAEEEVEEDTEEEVEEEEEENYSEQLNSNDKDYADEYEDEDEQELQDEQLTHDEEQNNLDSEESLNNAETTDDDYDDDYEEDDINAEEMEDDNHQTDEEIVELEDSSTDMPAAEEEEHMLNMDSDSDDVRIIEQDEDSGTQSLPTLPTLATQQQEEEEKQQKLDQQQREQSSIAICDEKQNNANADASQVESSTTSDNVLQAKPTMIIIETAASTAKVIPSSNTISNVVESPSEIQRPTSEINENQAIATTNLAPAEESKLDADSLTKQTSNEHQAAASEINQNPTITTTNLAKTQESKLDSDSLTKQTSNEHQAPASEINENQAIITTNLDEAVESMLDVDSSTKQTSNEHQAPASEINENQTIITTNLAEAAESMLDVDSSKKIASSTDPLEMQQTKMDAVPTISVSFNNQDKTKENESQAIIASKAATESTANRTEETIEEDPITLRVDDADSFDASEVIVQNTNEEKRQQEASSKQQASSEVTSPSDNDTTEQTNTLIKADPPQMLKRSRLSSQDFQTDSPMVLTPRRNLRGTSVPPQADSEEVSFPPTPHTRRSIRATSLQPKTKHEDESTPKELQFGTPNKRGKLEEIDEAHTPHSRRSIRATSLQPKTRNEALTANDTPIIEKLDESEDQEKSKRGSSVPPAKVSTRRRSIILDAINEDAASIDSPSTRTRLRSRLNSMDSELDSSLISVSEPATTQSKRSRRASLSSNISEQVLTPKRSRRNSISSQPDTTTGASGTPRNLRARSILSTQTQEDAESIPESSKSESAKRITTSKRKKSMDSKSDEEEKEQQSSSPKSDNYSTNARRLTRTQLAMMEKNKKASSSSSNAATSMPSETKSISPPENKRRGRPAKRSSQSATHDSDDVESISSRQSTSSNVSKLRSTRQRNSAKEKDETEDDSVSIASSVGSEKPSKSLRSKDKQSALTAIPEDDNKSIESKKRTRSTKH